METKEKDSCSVFLYVKFSLRVWLGSFFACLLYIWCSVGSQRCGFYLPYIASCIAFFTFTYSLNTNSRFAKTNSCTVGLASWCGFYLIFTWCSSTHTRICFLYFQLILVGEIVNLMTLLCKVAFSPDFFFKYTSKSCMTFFLQTLLLF